MICVEVHSNNVLALRSDTLSNAVSDSIKHETIKFLFPDNWNNYQKTAVFSAAGVEPINVLLCEENPLCLSKDECYIPFEVLKGDCFEVSVFGVLDETLATTTKEQIEVLQSGYTLGDQPSEPTQSEYSQILQMVIDTKQIAQSVRDDANNGVFKGEKGEKGDKGEEYSLTDADKAEIVQEVESKIENLETDVETIKQGYVTLDYIENTYPDAQTVDRRIAEYDLTVQETYATKQYVDDAVVSNGVVSQEYVDNAIAGVQDIAENNESDIAVIRQQTGTLQNKVQGLEDDVETIKQGYVSVDYVNEKTKNIPVIEEDVEILKQSSVSKEYVDGIAAEAGQSLTYIAENYATKEYVDDAVASSGGGTGGGVSSWNDLTDKPFFDEGIKTATLDYNNLPDIKISPSDELTFYKVTDDILSESILNGSQITAVTTNANGETVSNSLEISGFPANNEFEFGKVFANVITEGLMFFVAIATKTGQFEVDGSTIEVAETGTYFSLMPTSGETPNLMSLEYNYLKSLDIKFIPNELYTEIDQRIENYINEALGGDY